MLSLFSGRRSRRGALISSRLNNMSVERDSLVMRKHRPDYVLFIVSMALLVIGLIVVYSISPGLAASQNVSQGHYISKQLISIMLGLAAFFLLSMVSLSALKESKRALIWISGLMILAVQLFGEKVNGAYRWVQVGGFSFQVAELVKISLIIWLASFLVSRVGKGEITSSEKTIKPIIYILVLIGVLVAGLESDFGSAGVMVAILAVMAFTAGMPIKKLAIICSIVSLGMVLLVASTDYRRDRLNTFLNPASDCQSSGYQACQALIAVGSGGVFGLGLGNSVQAYGYLPEAANDSIFAIIGEKFGFVGGTLIIGLYALLFSRMRKIIQCSQDLFSRLFVVGVLAWLSTQAVINIGAMIGILPLKGITLPLISYGGTSIIFVLAALGIVFRISKYTAYAPVRNVRIDEPQGVNSESTIGRRGQRRPYYAASSNR